MKYLCFLIFWGFVTTTRALAHEFWIEPEQYQVESAAPLVAHLRNGEKFKGVSLGWFENRISRFEMISADTATPVAGRMGDTPALQTTAPQDGLLVIVHETTPSTLTYTKWEKFLKFVEHKDFAHAVATHAAKEWPREGFRESYTRHAKALVAVGAGTGDDRPLGLATEFIALTNPYAADFDGQMHVLLAYEDQPRTDAQVEVFSRAPDGTVSINLYRTDGTGRVVIPVKPGYAYLFDAVVLRPSEQAGASDRAPVWETLWAALTFAVPAR